MFGRQVVSADEVQTAPTSLVVTDRPAVASAGEGVQEVAPVEAQASSETLLPEAVAKIVRKLARCCKEASSRKPVQRL